MTPDFVSIDTDELAKSKVVLLDQIADIEALEADMALLWAKNKLKRE